MQAGFISVMGFWVGGYGGFEAVVVDPAPITIAYLRLTPDVIISGQQLLPDVTIQDLAAGN